MAGWGVLESLNEKIPTVVLEDPLVLIGRHSSSTSNLRFDDRKVSSRHCEITHSIEDEQIIRIKDLSANGTFVNGARVGKGNFQPLKHGDVITISAPEFVGGDPTSIAYVFNILKEDDRKKAKKAKEKVRSPKPKKQLAPDSGIRLQPPGSPGMAAHPGETANIQGLTVKQSLQMLKVEGTSRQMRNLHMTIKKGQGGWVDEFIGNDGLDSLLDSLSATHAKPRAELTEADEMAEADIIRCLITLLNEDDALARVLESRTAVQNIALSLDTNNELIQRKVSKLLSGLACVGEQGHTRVLEAFDHMKKIRHLRRRFQLILSGLSKEEPYPALKMCLMMLVNGIVNTPVELDIGQRAFLRQEFVDMGILDIIEVMRDLRDEALDLQCNIFVDEMEKGNVETKWKDVNLEDPLEIASAIVAQNEKDSVRSHVLGALRGLLLLHPSAPAYAERWSKVDEAIAIVAKGSKDVTARDIQEVLGKPGDPSKEEEEKGKKKDENKGAILLSEKERKQLLDEIATLRQQLESVTSEVKELLLQKDRVEKEKVETRGEQANAEPSSTEDAKEVVEKEKKEKKSSKKDAEKESKEKKDGDKKEKKETEGKERKERKPSKKDVEKDKKKESKESEKEKKESDKKDKKGSKKEADKEKKDAKKESEKKEKKPSKKDPEKDKKKESKDVEKGKKDKKAHSRDKHVKKDKKGDDAAVEKADTGDQDAEKEKDEKKTESTETTETDEKAVKTDEEEVKSAPATAEEEEEEEESTGGPPPPPPPGPPGPPPPPGAGPPPPPGPPGAPMMQVGPQLKPKPTIVPNAKMKPVYWTKIKNVEYKESVWEGLNDEKIKVDGKEVEELFRMKPTALASSAAGDSAQPAAPATPKKVGPKTILDMGRANNIGIMLSRFRVSYDDIRLAIVSLDKTKLSVEKIKSLIKFAPTEDENSALGDISEAEMKAEYGKPDQFLYMMRSIPRVEIKLDCFLISLTVNDDIAEVKEAISSVQSATTELRNAKNFFRLLEIILAVGNYINGNTPHGGAYGFRLTSLGKLLQSKSLDGKMTLLHYVVQVIQKKYPELLDCPSQLAAIEGAIRSPSFNELNQTLNQLTGKLKKVEREADLCRDIPLGKKLKEFHSVAIVLVDSAKQKAEAAEKDFTALVKFLTANEPASNTPDKLFGLVFSFTKSFEKCVRDNEREEKRQKAVEAAEEKTGKKIGGGRMKQVYSTIRDGKAFQKDAMAAQIQNSLQLRLKAMQGHSAH